MSEMGSANRSAVRLLARAANWPWSRARLTLGRWRRGHFYGIRQPRWWPAALGGWPGPRSPHENKRVVIFVGADRYEFAPAAWRGYSGHVYHGTHRPDAHDLERRLSRLNLPIGAARTLAVISGFEGGFDSIQTYDRGKFAWGFIQFTATGGLPRLLLVLKTIAADVFEEYFIAGGIDIEAGGITLRVNGRTVRRRRALDLLHDDPSFWTPFLRASRLSQVQDLQVKTAYDCYYASPLGIVVTLESGDISLGTLFADDEYARAVVCDRAVNLGVGHTTILFKQAARLTKARTIADAPAILECVRAMEAVDAERLNNLEAAFRRSAL